MFTNTTTQISSINFLFLYPSFYFFRFVVYLQSFPGSQNGGFYICCGNRLKWEGGFISEEGVIILFRFGRNFEGERDFCLGGMILYYESRWLYILFFVEQQEEEEDGLFLI